VLGCQYYHIASGYTGRDPQGGTVMKALSKFFLVLLEPVK